MGEEVKLTTKRLILRELKKSDEKELFENANNVNISKWVPNRPHPYTITHAKDFIVLCIKQSKEKPRNNYEFGIELKSEKKIIGVIGITQINRFHNDCGIAYWIGEKYWRNGYASEAVEKIIEFIFKNLKLRRINICAFADNVGSNKLIKKMGFKYEGTRRKYVKDKATGTIHDQKIYGMLKEDWK